MALQLSVKRFLKLDITESISEECIHQIAFPSIFELNVTLSKESP